jgi:hypothetical protein
MIKPKPIGSAIMVSDFIEEITGFFMNESETAREYLEVGQGREGY